MSEPWLERWQEGRIGWHEPDGSASLKHHWRTTGRRVLVPLCGKSVDLVWLAGHGNRVVGVELSELAIRAFFEEQGLDYAVREGRLPAFHTADESITIYCGDYFDLESIECDAHYDRAALVALPAEVRPRYAVHTDELLGKSVERLVVTLEYDESIATGPPFSVTTDELLSYWPELTLVEEREDIANGPPKFREAGLTEMLEKVWRSA